MIMIPFWTSFLIRTYVWMTILGEQGIINYVLQFLGITQEPIRMLYTMGAVIIASIYLFIPFPILTIYASLEKLGFSVQEAAMDLGATPWQAFRKVTFPLSLAGVQSSIIFVFIPVMGLFVTPALVGGTKGTMIAMLQVNIFKKAANFPLGSAISFMSLVIVLLFVAGLGRSGDVVKIYSGGVG